MGEAVDLIAADGHRLSAYESGPDDATAGVVVIQEIFGVNDHIRSVVDRYAALGYRSIAPAMFDRVERAVELDYTADGVTRGRAIKDSLSWDDAVIDVEAARAHVGEAGPVAVVGYCYGGSVAWLAACELELAAAVGYYGAQINDMRDRVPRCPTMLHFGGLDAAIPLDGVAEIAEAHPGLPIHVYDGADHGFNCDARASYHHEAAALALDRTKRLLADHLDRSAASAD